MFSAGLLFAGLLLCQQGCYDVGRVVTILAGLLLVFGRVVALSAGLLSIFRGPLFV